MTQTLIPATTRPQEQLMAESGVSRFLLDRLMEQGVVTSHPNVVSGTYVFAGTRVPLYNLWDYLTAGDSLDDFLDSFPTVPRPLTELAIQIAMEDTTQSKIQNLKSKIPIPLLVSLLLLAGVAGLGLPPLLAWQRTSQRRAVSLSNLRRLAVSLQLYAQDYDEHLMPPAIQDEEGAWRTWPERLRPYNVATLLDNPANSLESAPQGVHHPVHGYRVTTAYALNRRFWDTFSPDSFPFDNLELPAQTVLLVESGPLWRQPRTAPASSQDRAQTGLLDYNDTLDRIDGFFPYPSAHDGKMAVVAADGHTATIRIEHYYHSDGPHDPLYGRLGGEIYNWNGGHANGEVDRPARE